MRLESNNGVSCDQCGLQLVNDFDYYDFVVTSRKFVANLEVYNTAGTPLDICPGCYERCCDKVKHVYKFTPLGVNCDLCGAVLRGTFYCSRINVGLVCIMQCKVIKHDEHVVVLDVCQKCLNDLNSRRRS